MSGHTTEKLKSLTDSIWISGPLAQTNTSPNWAVCPPLPLIQMKLCLCRHNSTSDSRHNSVDWNRIDSVDSVDSEADLVDTTVFVLLCRDPRLVPMTYGPQAMYRPADNTLGRLRVTISQVLCGVETLGTPRPLSLWRKYSSFDGWNAVHS